MSHAVLNGDTVMSGRATESPFFPQDPSSLAGEPTIENHISTDGLKSQCHKEAYMMGKETMLGKLNLRGWDRERSSGNNDIPRPAG